MKYFFLLFLFFALLSCSRDESVKFLTKPVPVKTAIAERKDVVQEIQLVGNVSPSATVNLIPRVSGEIIATFFKEGQEVKEGDILVELDTRPYRAVLEERQANLARSKALLAKAFEDRKRYGKLAQNGYVSREALDETMTSVSTLKADVKAAEASVNNALLDLDYCQIRAPINGRIGKLNVQKGNMVFANSSEPIAQIDTIAPSYVLFSLPEIYLEAIKKNMSHGPVPLAATPIGGRTSVGEIMLLDNSVDKSTGTIQLRGIFPNGGYELWPGQFVNIKLPLAEMKDALVVPAAAVQAGRTSSQVYVIDEAGKAELVAVTPLFESENEMVVEGNLHSGQKVVVEGQMRLAPGASVEEIAAATPSQN